MVGGWLGILVTIRAFDVAACWVARALYCTQVLVFGGSFKDAILLEEQLYIFVIFVTSTRKISKKKWPAMK